MSRKITKDEKIALNRLIKKYKEVRDSIKPLEKEKDVIHKGIKEIVNKYEQDFDLPAGKTDSRPWVRESYNRDRLDELLDSGLIDDDTKQLILNCRETNEGYSIYVL